MIHPIALIILFIVLCGIMFRQFIPKSPPIWLFMFCGAIAVCLLQQITWHAALDAISFEIMGYLFGVFIIAEALEQSGVLENITDRLFNRCRTGVHALLIVVFVLGLSSALLMNDTVAIIGTPIVLQLCRKQPQLTTPLLLALAYSVTIGSVLSPIGNPQNLLIAVHGNVPTPFVSFFTVLAIPTLINLVLTALILLWFHRKTFNKSVEPIAPIAIVDKRTARLSLCSLFIMIVLIGIKIIMDNTGLEYTLDFSAIALVSALPIFVGSQNRLSIVKKIDWGTLLFFIGMFILMQSVWDSGVVQVWIDRSHIVLSKIPSILAISTIASQFISNVPLVALYLPLLSNLGAHMSAYLALAAGSTIAGNLFIFGAASNIIIMQNTEKRGHSAFSFWQFSGLGVVITVVNLLVYAVFIS